MTNTERTYIALLLLPHNGLRARLQEELAACRDAIALCDDGEAEATQNEYEAIAGQISRWLPDLVSQARSVLSATERRGE